MGRKGGLVFLLPIGLFLSCIQGGRENEPSITDKFSAYLHEAFNEQIPEEEHFYLFTTEKVCALCAGPHFSSFNEFQNILNNQDLSVITDFPCKKRLNSSLSEVCRYDSLGLFNHYSFPKAYLTFYRTKSGEVKSYAFYKQSAKFMEFAQKHGRLMPSDQ